MKRHLEEGPSQGLGGPKESLYSRPTPVSPPGHILGPSIPTPPSTIISNVQGVQGILHMASQQGPVPPNVSQTMYSKDTTVQYQYNSSKTPANPSLHVRHKVHTSTTLAVPGPGTPPGTTSQNYQRLKVEDALSYLDQVKFKFGSQPQVYNDFLDIMKEFKSQSIDTPGVIQRVSNLFKGHPELIVGFNTFLPPGYKIEVQSNEQGFAFQVSVSMPSPTTSTTTLIQTTHPGIVSQGESITLIPGLSKHVPPALCPRPMSPPTVVTHFPTTLVNPAAPGPPPTTTTNASTPVSSSIPPAQNQGLLTPSPFSMLPITQQQAHLAVSHALSNVDAPHPTTQPVEFNHAINYVNKIKNRFQGQPDKYKKFLEILHTYQKNQRNEKEGLGKQHTEKEVYSQVSKLFENQEDLLTEFGQFLPDATSSLNAKNIVPPEHTVSVKKSTTTLKTSNLPRDSSGSDRETPRSGSAKPAPTSLKRSSSFTTSVPKKHKMASLRDVTIAEAGKYANLNDYAFFDKVRRVLKSPEVYENFLRCLMLYNHEIMSKVELVQLITPFLSRCSDLLRWLKDFLGVSEQATYGNRSDLLPVQTRQDRPTGDLAMEIDYTSCKRLGASYCALPKTYVFPKCSGRTALCREVLNDTWVSFPSWSEDSTFVSSRKTIYEENMYRCEDERFELDVVIETNAATIRVLESANKKMSRMTPDEVQKFRLDDCLGGTSPTIHVRAITRVYGDKASDMIDGLKKNPSVAIPVVLRRLRSKEEEWRDAQKGYNKIWREQNEKYYLKSLDHQGINFKQTDAKMISSKSLLGEIENIYEERHEQNDDGMQESGPHLVLPYKDKSILDDAAALLIHHAKRLTGIQKDDKHKIKVILRQFVPDLFHHPRQDLSDDEKEDDDMETDEKPKDPPEKIDLDLKSEVEPVKEEKEEGEETPKPVEETCSLFFANGHWYLFLRLHQLLCERLTKMYERAELLAMEEAKEKINRKEAVSTVLRLKPKVCVEVSDFYPTLVDMVKNVLDGNLENSTYEDNLREMFGIHAYMAFTLDKVVTHAVRQLQHIVCDDSPQGCMEFYAQEVKKGGAGGIVRTAHQRAHLEAAYQKKLEQLLAEENCFKIYIYSLDCKMTIELIDTDVEEQEPTTEVEKWATYRDTFVESIRNYPTEPDMSRVDKLIFLPRNIRQWKKIHSPDPTTQESVTSSDDIEIKKEGSPDDDEKQPLSRMGDNNHTGEIISLDNTECCFDLKSYKNFFVKHKGDILFRKNALSSARKKHPKITKRKDTNFKIWHNKWLDGNVPGPDWKDCVDWLMGKGPDMHPNDTILLDNNDLNRTPYRPYNRYSVNISEPVKTDAISK